MSRRGAQIVGVALVVIGGMLVSCAGTGSDTSAIGPAVSTTIDEAASLSSTEAPESEEPDGTITVVLDDLEGATGLVADAWVLPVNPTGEKEALGGASFSIGSDPFSDSDVVHPLGSRYFDIVERARFLSRAPTGSSSRLTFRVVRCATDARCRFRSSRANRSS